MCNRAVFSTNPRGVINKKSRVVTLIPHAWYGGFYQQSIDISLQPIDMLFLEFLNLLLFELLIYLSRLYVSAEGSIASAQ